MPTLQKAANEQLFKDNEGSKFLNISSEMIK